MTIEIKKEYHMNNKLFVRSNNKYFYNGYFYVSEEFNVVAYENRYDGTCDYWMNNGFESKRLDNINGYRLKDVTRELLALSILKHSL